MRTLCALFLLLFLLISSERSYSHGGNIRESLASDGEPTPTLYELLESQWAYTMREFPELATELGYPGQNARWTDHSFAAIERRQADANDLVILLREGNRYQFLSQKGKFDYDVIMSTMRDLIDGFAFHDELLPISQLSGIQQEIPSTLATQPNATVQDYGDILARMRGVPILVGQVIALMEKGIKLHIVQPKITMRDVPAQIQALLAPNPKNSPLLKPFREFPESIGEHERANLMSLALQVYRDSLAPALKKLYDFVVTTYIPNCRESIGMSLLPDGSAWYKQKIRHYTTTTMTPDQIFETGIKEVKRLRGKMDSVRNAISFKGDLQKFFDFLRTDPQFFYKDSASLVGGYKEIANKASSALPKLFGRLPKLTFEVLPVPAYDQKSQTTAYYDQGSAITGRPGHYFVNTYDLASRPKWEMESLTLHESVPGHHLQISLAQEIQNEPDIIKNSDFTAFVEGWALYAESLGTDLGFYQDPYSKMGRYTYEMWRSIRLVVDVGIHTKGWTRQQAIDFFTENSCKSKHDIEVEVDRYIVDPGQALAYKIGSMKIKALRTYAMKELGDKFDIRSFHDEVLGSGALPLEILDRKIKRWVQDQKNKKEAVNEK